jgi:hypothetical protein
MPAVNRGEILAVRGVAFDNAAHKPAGRRRPLVAIIGDPIDVAHTVREFVDVFREEFAADVARAAEIAAEPVNLSHPD